MKTRSCTDEPERTETQGAQELVGWLRGQLDACHRLDQRLLVLGAGASSTAPFLADLPARVTVLARYALPTDRATGRGRLPRTPSTKDRAIDCGGCGTEVTPPPSFIDLCQLILGRPKWCDSPS